MFQSKPPTDPQSGVTIISKGCSFEGRLFCRGVSRIGGSIDGVITAEGTLIIEKEAMIRADIEADIIVIQGTVHGKIEASSKAELLKTSVLEGELVCPSILVEEGSVLNAQVSMEPPAVVQESQETEDATDQKKLEGASVGKVEVLGEHKKRVASLEGSASQASSKVLAQKAVGKKA